MIGLRRSIRETDFSKLVDECLLRDAIREDPSQPNVNPVKLSSQASHTCPHTVLIALLCALVYPVYVQCIS